MDYSDLTEEQRERARAAKAPEEILAIAREEGWELSDAELEAVAGGGWIECDSDKCTTMNL